MTCMSDLNSALWHRRGVEVRRDMRSKTTDEEEDVDVARERQRVMLGGTTDDVLKIEELTKVTKGQSDGKMEHCSLTEQLSHITAQRGLYDLLAALSFHCCCLSYF